MQANKSAGCSTKATSIFASLSPFKNENQLFPKCEELQSKELLFYKVKNRELQEGALRLAERILELEQTNGQLLKINQRYVKTLNQQFKRKNLQFEKQMKQVKSNSHPFCKHCNRSILLEFQQDYRNLVKYTMVLKDQIESKNKDLAQLEQMKQQLSQTNHSQISTLVSEVAQTTAQTFQLKKELNRVEFEFEKQKAELQKFKKNSKASKNNAHQIGEQLEKYKSLINTIQNECIDKQRLLNQKIYQQDVVIQALEKLIRDSQIEKIAVGRKQQELRIKNLELSVNLRDSKKSLSQSKPNLGKKLRLTSTKEDWLVKVNSTKL